MLFFVTLSCLGALNGLTMSVVRGHYILSGRLLIGERRDRLFGEISAVTGIPVSSGIMGLLVSEAWLIVRFFSPSIGAEGLYFDPAEASISVMYAIYVPILLMMTVRLKIKSRVKRYILPVSAAIAASFVALAAPIAFGWAMVLFVLAVAAVTLIVLSIYRR